MNLNIEHRTSNIESKKEQKTAVYEAQFQSLATAIELVSCFGIQYTLDDLYISHQLL
jgi:hypothetical protein